MNIIKFIMLLLATTAQVYGIFKCFTALFNNDISASVSYFFANLILGYLMLCLLRMFNNVEENKNTNS